MKGKSTAMQAFDDEYLLSAKKRCLACESSDHAGCWDRLADEVAGPIMDADDAASASVLYLGCECLCQDWNIM